jgi:glycosyltransferase involved in cell wall biosynthesis
MPRRLRLLWVTPYLPVRGLMAARERWWYLLARLARRHDVTLLAFLDLEDAGAMDRLPPGLAAVHVVAKAPWFPPDPVALLPQTVAGGFSHPALRDAIAARLAAERFDVAQYEFSEMAHCIPQLAPRSILTVHQIGFAQQWPAWRAARHPLRRAPVVLHRYLRELDFELRAVRRVDHVVTMSAEDATRLRAFAPDLPVSVSPCGVDCREFAPATPSRAGHFNHPPNVDAVRFLAHEILPRLKRPARLRIVGRDVKPAVSALARPGVVEIVGPVPDVRPYLAGAAALVAPVRFGTGMRGKVLEALAMGCPVVTTSVGAEGLGALSGRDLVVADGADAFTAAVRRVLDEPGFAAALGAGGRALAEARFDWDAIATAHDAIYDAVLRAPARATLAPDRVPAAARVAGRLGYLPGVGAGFAVLLARAARWHARRVLPARRTAVSAEPATARA